jgi:hypothetical protein
LRPPPVPQPTLAETKLERADGQSHALAEAGAALDRAQGFCERGAHQCLRDGDYGQEITGAKAAFKDIIKISQQEVDILKKEREASAAVVDVVTATARIEEVAAGQEYKEQEQAVADTTHPGADVIEADDDEEGDEDKCTATTSSSALEFLANGGSSLQLSPHNHQRSAVAR